MPACKTTSKAGKKSWSASFYYTDWTGAQRHKFKRGFETKRDAESWEREFLERQRTGSEGMTFKALTDIYLEDCRSRLKPTSFEKKEYLLKLQILPFFQDCMLSDITPATVRKWQNHLLEAKFKPCKNQDPSKEQKYSATYVKMLNAQLSAIFNFAVRYYRLPTNPAKLAGSVGKQHANRIDFWTREEFEAFAKAISDKPLSYAAFNILFWTGCRIGELLALTLADFDFVNKTMRINKNYARINRKDLILAPKTPKSHRTVTLPDPLISIIRDYLKERYEPQQNERLFEVTKSYFLHEMRRGCESSGVKRIRVHDLRHSHASLLIEMGCTPLLVKDRLGHENIQTTLNTYSHLYPNKQSEVASKLGEIMSKRKPKNKK